MNKKQAQQLADTYERSHAPLYVQVADVLRGRIQEGRWQSGDKISTLEELEKEFEVARVTVRQAIMLLQKEGLVQRRQGKGTFVTGAPPDNRWLKLATEWNSLIESIKDNVPHGLPFDGPPPNPRLDKGDGTQATKYAYMKSIQTREGEPYAFARVHVDQAIFAKDPKGFLNRTALTVLAARKDVHIARAHQTFVIGAADMETAQALGLALNAPTAEVHCVVVDERGVAVYVADITYRGDCVRFDINLLHAGSD